MNNARIRYFSSERLRGANREIYNNAYHELVEEYKKLPEVEYAEPIPMRYLIK